MGTPPIPPLSSDGGGYAAARRAALDYLLANYRDLLIHPGAHQGETGRAIEEAVAACGAEAHQDGLTRDLRDHILGAGPLQRHLDEPGITEIMVNGAQVIVERAGRLEPAQGFDSPEDAFRLIETMALRMGERLQLAQPILDFRWQDGSRVNVIHPILTQAGVAVTIRKPDRSRPLDLQSLVTSGTLTSDASDYLVQAINRRRNVIFSGSQGSGKTTLLRAVLHEALRPNPMQRVVVIEDTPELALGHPHTVALQAHHATSNDQGARAVGLADLTRAAKRMRPDRLIIGEVRGAEGIDLIDAAQSEAVGVTTTLHIGGPEDLTARFYYFATQASLGISMDDMRGWVFGTFHIVCHLDKDQGGRRRVTRIVSLSPNGQMADVFRYEPGEGRLIEVPR